MLFTPVIVEVKGYFEVFFEESPPFKLSLTDAVSGHTVWTATIREGTASAHKQTLFKMFLLNLQEIHLKPSTRPKTSKAKC